MSGPFVKLYGSILDSSVWGESHATVRVWIAMLAMADADGVVTASLSGLRRRANVSADECAQALEVLQGADGDDSSGVGEGERVIKQQGGWLVVNHRRYRDLRTPKQVADAERKAAWRAEQAEAEQQEASAGLRLLAGTGPSCDQSQMSQPIHAKAEAEAKAEAYTEAEAEAEQRCICDVKPAGGGSGESVVTLVAGCPIHAPARDPLVEALAEALINTGISERWQFAERAIGSVNMLGFNLTPEHIKQAVSEALADAPSGITDEALRRKVRAYIKQAAKTPPGERDARERAAADAALPKLKRLRCSNCKANGDAGELIPQLGSRTLRQCDTCHVNVNTARPGA